MFSFQTERKSLQKIPIVVYQTVPVVEEVRRKSLSENFLRIDQYPRVSSLPRLSIAESACAGYLASADMYRIL